MPITLEPWQLFVICCAFGWVNKGTRLRRFREVYTEIPRKNGKSAISAGVALYCFACDNEFGAEVYSGATTEKQAWEVFRPARLMCKRTPMLTEAFGIEVNASNMNRPEDGARFEPLIGTALRALLLSRKNPFGDIKSDGTVKTALENLGLGEGAPAIGVPFFWPSAAMPNTVIDSWSSMVFLKFNGAKFSATDYPVLAKVFPALALPDARGDFIRIWDDGRGVDRGRTLLSAQADDFKMHEHKFLGTSGNGSNVVFGTISNAAPLYTNGISQPIGGALPAFQNPGGNETRPRNITFNFLVRAK